MIVAHQKKQENIIEYLLYMWQVEDLARANQLNLSLIEKNIISQYKQSPEVLDTIREWWKNLVAMMVQEKKEKSGHLQVNINTLNDVNRFHLQLLSDSNEIAYKHLYNSVVGLIRTFDEKSNCQLSNDIEVCLTAIYTTFLLKIQGKEISKGTEEANMSFSKLLAMLAAKYKDELEK